MVSKICRRPSPRVFAFSAVGLTIVLCVYYANYTSVIGQTSTQSQDGPQAKLQSRLVPRQEHIQQGTCPTILPADADVSTYDVYKDFDFQVRVQQTFVFRLHVLLHLF